MDISHGLKSIKLTNKIIITGPECTGKTSLSKKLSKSLSLEFSEEYARTYIANLNRPYNFDDLLIIAKNQFYLEEKQTLLDTDLITLKIWSNFKYKKCDKWIIDKINQQKKEKRLYLLCKPDIPWVFDPQRENPLDRKLIFELFKSELDLLGHEYYVIEGTERLNLALSIIQKNFK